MYWCGLNDNEMMLEEEQTTTHPKKMKKRSKIVTGFAWGTAVLLVPACTLWFFGRWIYVADVLASQQMLIGWIALVVALLVLSTLRWGAGFLCLALALISLYPVLVGRTLLLEHVDFDHKPEGSIRVVSCNINPLNETWVQDVHRLLDLDADIVIVIELSPEMSRSINNRGAVVDDRYPQSLVPDVGAGRCVGWNNFFTLANECSPYRIRCCCPRINAFSTD